MLLVTIIVLVQVAPAFSQNSYIATFKSEETSGERDGIILLAFLSLRLIILGATGYFQLSLDQTTQGSYSWNIDLTNFATTCDLTAGLNFHVHTYWNYAYGSSVSCSSTGACNSDIQYLLPSFLLHRRADRRPLRPFLGLLQ